MRILRPYIFFVPFRHLWLFGEYASRIHEWGQQAVPGDRVAEQLDFMQSWEKEVGDAVVVTDRCACGFKNIPPILNSRTLWSDSMGHPIVRCRLPAPSKSAGSGQKPLFGRFGGCALGLR
jgi:hypothetical protein